MSHQRSPWSAAIRNPGRFFSAGFLGAATFVAVSIALNARAAEPRGWPQWRGPSRDGVAIGASLPEALPQHPPPQKWSAPLGTGWSSPVVDAGRVFITDRQDARERILALDADTGRVLWQREHPVDFDPHSVGRQHGNGPKATPLAAGDTVYWLGIAGWLEALAVLDGAVRWQVNLPAQFGQVQPLPGGRAQVVGTEHVLVPTADGQGAPAPLFGYTGSPVLVEGRLVLEVGGRRGGTVMAFDARSGELVWKALDENVAYSSPVAATIDGVTQVVTMTGPRVVGLAAADGKLLWSHPFQIQYDESISTPCLAGDLALITGDRRPLTALRIARQVDRWSATKVWENRDLSSYLSSMLVHQGHVYGMNDGGEFSCVRLSDGATLWTGGDDGFYSSPVLVGGRALALNERGLLQVWSASPVRFERLGQYTLTREATWTVPAPVGRRLYVRDAAAVRCFEWPE